MKDKVAGLGNAVNVAPVVKKRKKRKKRKVIEEEKKWCEEGGEGQDLRMMDEHTQIRSHWDLLDRADARRAKQEEWSSEREQMEYEDSLDIEDKFQRFLRQREEEKRKVKEEVQDEKEACSLHPLQSPKFIMEEKHVTEISPDRQPEESRRGTSLQKILGLSVDMRNFVDELLQEQGKAGDEEERKRKGDANNDKLCEANDGKLPEAEQGNWFLQAWCRGEWAEKAEKEGLVRLRMEREEIEEREAMRKRAHNKAMWLQEQEDMRLQEQEDRRNFLSRGLFVNPWENLGAENRDEEGRWIYPRVQAPPQLPQAQQQLHPQPRLQPRLQAHQQQEDVKVITDTVSEDSSQLIENRQSGGF